MISAILLAAVCLNPTTGECLPYLGSCPEGFNVNTMFGSCPSASPGPTPTRTPTAGPTPTRTPTPAPLVYTVQTFLKSTDLGYTYVMSLSMINKVVWGTGGVCCPGMPDPNLPPGQDPNNKVGECLFCIDYNKTPPVFREWVCSSRDSKSLWEVSSSQISWSDQYKWIAAVESTNRAATDSLITAGTASHISGFGVQSLDVKPWSWHSNTGEILYPEHTKRWPLAILDLDGIRWLYLMVFPLDGSHPFSLQRWSWPRAYSVALYNPTTNLGALKDPLSPIAIDKDGTLVSTVDVASPTAVASRLIPRRITVAPMWFPSSDANAIKIVRSKDQGRTWSETGQVIQAPTGTRLWGCGWEHTGGGAAVQPWHLICTISTGKGPEVGDWNAADVRVSGATVPASFGQKPVVK